MGAPLPRHFFKGLPNKDTKRKSQKLLDMKRKKTEKKKEDKTKQNKTLSSIPRTKNQIRFTLNPILPKDSDVL